LGIDLEQLDKEQHDENNFNDNASRHSRQSNNSVDNRVSKHTFNSTVWLNDSNALKKTVNARLDQLGLNQSVFEAVYFHRNMLVNEMKRKDKNLTGLIKKLDVIDTFSKINLNDLTTKNIYDIINIYSNGNMVDYTKFLASLLKDIRSKIYLVNFLDNFGLNDQMKKSFHMTSRTQTQNSVRFENQLAKSVSEITSKTQRDQKIELKDVQREVRTIKSMFDLIIKKVSKF
jgi:hypothetical protein